MIQPAQVTQLGAGEAEEPTTLSTLEVQTVLSEHTHFQKYVDCINAAKENHPADITFEERSISEESQNW